MTEAMSPTGKTNELRMRILSALVLAPVALGVTWFGGWPFAALIALAAIAMAFELTNLLTGLSPTLRMLLVSTAFGAVVFTALGGPFVALIVTLACLTFAMMIAAFTGASAVIPTLAFAFPYIILPAVALVWLRLDQDFGRIAVFWLFFVVWATDTFAYFAGRGIGGPKLAPRLSPNKTWAGLIGGMAGAALVGIVTAIWFNLGSPAQLGLVSAVLAVVAQGGDILESALKRRAGVKDSGKLIPGHGGILDRVDGLITAAVAAGVIAVLHVGASPAAGVLIWP
jgi:phosphatidate cytidylyltransferase